VTGVFTGRCPPAPVRLFEARKTKQAINATI